MDKEVISQNESDSQYGAFSRLGSLSQTWFDFTGCWRRFPKPDLVSFFWEIFPSLSVSPGVGVAFPSLFWFNRLGNNRPVAWENLCPDFGFIFGFINETKTGLGKFVSCFGFIFETKQAWEDFSEKWNQNRLGKATPAPGETPAPCETPTPWLNFDALNIIYFFCPMKIFLLIGKILKL